MSDAAKDAILEVINENGEMRAKLDSIKRACRVFMDRNPNWILTANKQEYKMLTVSVLTAMDMLIDHDGRERG